MKGIISKWKFFIVLIIFTIITLLLYPETGKQSISFAGINFINFIFLLTPIFICIGLLDTWVERKTMIKIIGEKSGVRGVIVAFLLGVVTAVPLYALLPVAGMMLKKGSKISNVLIFICSCASIRIPLILFEVSSLGWKYTSIRFVVNILVVLAIAFIINKALTIDDKKIMYENAKNF